jgi:hypothetical protein
VDGVGLGSDDGGVGSLGVTLISVGVGTGGWSRIGGAEDDDSTGPDEGGAVVAIGAADGAVATGGTTALDAAGCWDGANCTSASGWTPARRGARPIPSLPMPAPRPPVPAGAPT